MLNGGSPVWNCGIVIVPRSVTDEERADLERRISSVENQLRTHESQVNTDPCRLDIDHDEFACVGHSLETDFVAGLECLPRPAVALPGRQCRAGQLDRVIHDVSTVVGHVQM